MGIPGFFRWLVRKYPHVTVDVREANNVFVNGVPVPIDTTQKNPNGFEFDNLYLDMNGIIHPCFHPEGAPAPTTYDEVIRAVFKYIDRLFSIVRPRKLLYMAIDGVAPRAKMNQQRARRFTAAKEAAAKDAADEAPRPKRRGGIYKLIEKNLATKKMDSNVITPGTEFMAFLSLALQYYVHLRMNVDPGWQGIKVILSDASVPGEGEHKIMSYIRLQRNLPGYDPNTRHCLYGLDADLILLALATHEIHFSILREDVSNAKKKGRGMQQGKGSIHLNRCKDRGKLKGGKVHGRNVEECILRQKFLFLNIGVLRKYLARDLRKPDPTVKVDLECLIDDFIFMCLFVGNDYLPGVPSLDIVEGAIDLLIVIYKKEFIQMGGCLTDSFKVNLERVEHFVQAVGSHEKAIFGKRSKVRKNLNKRKNTIDKVKLGEEGWKERYYTEKFEVKIDDDREGIRRHAVLKYIEGICWVMHYYYQGICSWQWFYPYHYAPFASDFKGVNQLKIHFTLGKPFKPFDQLMGVLPAASAHALPLFYRKLMTEPSSPILDFYPTDFEVDMDGKRASWQGVCKLPFIKESRLLSEIAKVEHTLTDEEMRRNSLGLDILFVHISHPLARKIFSFCMRKKDHPKLSKAKVKRKIDPKFSGGMNGYVYISDRPVSPMEIFSPIGGMEIIADNKVISVFYKCPSFHSHIPKPPNGVILPEKPISKQDLPLPPVLGHENSAILGHVPERPITRSVSERCIENLVHRLVSECHLAKQQERVDGGSEYKVAKQQERMDDGGSENKVVKQQDRMDDGGHENNVNVEAGKSKQSKVDEGPKKMSGTTRIQRKRRKVGQMTNTEVTREIFRVAHVTEPNEDGIARKRKLSEGDEGPNKKSGTMRKRRRKDGQMTNTEITGENFKVAHVTKPNEDGEARKRKPSEVDEGPNNKSGRKARKMTNTGGMGEIFKVAHVTKPNVDGEDRKRKPSEGDKGLNNKSRRKNRKKKEKRRAARQVKNIDVMRENFEMAQVTKPNSIAA